jgi:hypothetical protein
MHRPVSLETIDPRSTGAQRTFGLGLCAALLVAAGLRWRGGASPPALLLMLSFTFLIVSAVLPWALRPLLAGWIRAAGAAGWLAAHLLLGLVFCVMIAPARLVLKATGEDPLAKHWDPDAETYWEEPEEHPGETETGLGQSARGVWSAMFALPLFLRRRKRFWLAPIAVALLLLSLLMFLIGSLGGWSPYLRPGP